MLKCFFRVSLTCKQGGQNEQKFAWYGDLHSEQGATQSSKCYRKEARKAAKRRTWSRYVPHVQLCNYEKACALLTSLIHSRPIPSWRETRTVSHCVGDVGCRSTTGRPTYAPMLLPTVYRLLSSPSSVLWHACFLLALGTGRE